MDAYVMFYLISALFPLLVIVGIVDGIVALVRRRGKANGEDNGIGTLKRVYFYGLAFIALGVAAPGLIVLLDFLLDSVFGSPALYRSETQLALGLALTVVATPIWFIHWQLALRAVQRMPGEAHTLARKIYLYLVLGVSAALAAFGLVSFLRWLLGWESFNGLNIAFPLVWLGVWAYHWHVQEAEGRGADTWAAVRRLYWYVTALYGLAMLATGVGLVLWVVLQQAYQALFDTQILAPSVVGFWSAIWTGAARTGIAIALAGGLGWWWHWHRAAKGDINSVLRQVFLHLFAVLGGAATVVVSLSVLLFLVLQWFFGKPESAMASAHFRSLPGVIAALVPGTVLWGYHWALVQQESRLAAQGWQAARRVYRYLVAALGLGTLSVGLVMVFLVVLGLLIPRPGTPLLDTQWWRNSLVLGVTLLVVGIPVWSYHWFGLQRDVLKGSPQEHASLSRRIFIYGVFGIATLLVLANLSAFLFMFLRDLLEGELSLKLIQDAKWSIGTLLMAGAISVYHWLVLQEDRRAVPPPEEPAAPAIPVSKAITALASEPARALVEQLQSRMGVTIRVLQRLDGGEAPRLTDVQLDEVQARIAASPGSQVLLAIDASGVQVIPYREL